MPPHACNAALVWQRQEEHGPKVFLNYIVNWGFNELCEILSQKPKLTNEATKQVHNAKHETLEVAL